MIKARELRIGNFISDDDGVLAKVIGFMPFEHSIRCDEEEGCQLLVDCYHANGSRRSGCATDSPVCNPIPLTPEWLERCGFGNEDGSTLWDNGIITIFDYNENNIYSFHYQSKKASIEYLHQLQNLYHALTGEELIITL
jgi:hypothetical protein